MLIAILVYNVVVVAREGGTLTVWLFYYTLTIMLLAAFAGAISFSAFTISRRKTYLGSAILSVIYFFDIALVFRSSLLSNLFPHQALNPYTITGPYESILLGALLIIFTWYITFSYLNLPLKWIAIPSLSFIVLSLFFYFGISDPMWREFFFFTARAIGFLSLFSCVAIYYFLTKNRVKKVLIKKQSIFFLVSFVLCLATIIWNLYFMVYSSLNNLSQWPFLPERNFAENAFILFVVWYIALRAVYILRLHMNQPPTIDLSHEDEFVLEEAGLYSRKYNLSPAESKVLVKIVQGNTNQQIASALFVEVTTVKVHVHNILKKTGRASRNEIISDFWHSH